MYQQNYGYMPQAPMAQPSYMRQMQTMQPLASMSTMPGALAQGIKGRPVASLDEARAQTIDFDGSIFFFPNLGNNVIYTKQINPDGTASLNAYQLVEPPVSAPVVNTPSVSLDDFVTKEELNAAIQDVLNKITVPTVTPEEAKPVVNSAITNKF